MKKMMIGAVAFAAAMLASAETDAFTFENDANGYSYILVNKDLDAFKFDVSKYGETTASDNRDGKWGAGHFKYYIYKGDVVAKTTTTKYGRYKKTTTTYVDSETGNAIELKDIAKDATEVNLGKLDAGMKIGFMFDDRGTAEWAYSFADSGKFQNGNVYSTYTAADGETLVSFASASGNGSNWDDWMAISVSATTHAGGSTNGAPLPGALAVIAVGLMGAYGMKKSEKKLR